MRNALASIDWLTEQEQAPLALTESCTLADGVALFQRDADLRLLTIVDDRRRPVGAIFEKDVRRLLLNPFGHALLRNPTFNENLTSHRRACPVHELTDDIGALIDHYRRAEGREGMVLTRDGQLFATLSNRRLLLLASEREHELNAARLQRAERIERSGRRFEEQAGTLGDQMFELANAVQRLAEETVERATLAGSGAAAVASAAVQTRDSMTQVAERGAGLSRAFGGIEQSLVRSRETARSTVERVSTGSRRAHALMESAHSIDSVMGLVKDIAGTVNLLSLNATIEAARAGDAGRGFSVVAGEIRALSDETHHATDRIASEIEAMRSGVRSVAGDYSAMEAAIDDMVTAGSLIDAAISQEADSTRMIAASVAEASAASHLIENSVSEIARSVRAASSSALELDALAGRLREGAERLRQEVSLFLTDVREA